MVSRFYLKTNHLNNLQNEVILAGTNAIGYYRLQER